MHKLCLIVSRTLIFLLFILPLASQAGAITGTKWGADTTLGTSGGTVSWSLMATGVSCSQEFSGCVNTHLSEFAPSSFLADLVAAFDLWSEVANINFVMTNDNGFPFNSGLQGAIRIGGHAFDGALGTLAHGYYPPPNGFGAAGDIHFDIAEQWSSTGGFIDFKTVAIHEIGHAIGLLHSTVAGATMSAFYTGADHTLHQDDITTVQSIYGVAIPEPATLFLLIFMLGLVPIKKIF